MNPRKGAITVVTSACSNREQEEMKAVKNTEQIVW